jgi:uncharacterized protein YxeA
MSTYLAGVAVVVLVGGLAAFLLRKPAVGEAPPVKKTAGGAKAKESRQQRK